MVKETTTLSSLTIGRRAVIAAPDGYGVTMTVDVVGTPVRYGTYKGKVMLAAKKNG